MNDGIRFAMNVLDGFARIYRTVEFWRPLVALPQAAGLQAVLAPTLALGALLALLLLSGVAIGSLASLVTALLLAVLILDEIFGLAVEIAG